MIFGLFYGKSVKCRVKKILETISKKGFLLRVKAEPSFNPQAYLSMLRT